MLDKYELKETFKNNIVTVTFVKKDGTERVLKGTLLTEHLPEFEADNEGISDSRENDKILAVWDIEANGWRSFRLDSVKKLVVQPVP